jgi:hypothetical protein
MYIGEFIMTRIDDAWTKNTMREVLLWKPAAGNTLQAVMDPDTGFQKRVAAMNSLGTFGYKSAVSRYCSISEINSTYWVMSAEC